MAMRCAFGADDSNATTAAVLERLEQCCDLSVVDDHEQWPDIGREVGRRVASGEADFGVVMCWTGTGVTMAANKVPGVRAALAWDAWVAGGARRWNDANVLGLSLKRLAPDVAVECLEAFLDPENAPDPAQQENIASLG
jgi:ribose 5-phosphate isomerase B